MLYRSYERAIYERLPEKLSINENWKAEELV